MDMEKWVKMHELHDEVLKLYYDVDDEVVEEFFDVESMKNLKKKKRVLQMIKDGKGKEDIGKDYYDILEKLEVPEGQYLLFSGEKLDPHEFD